MPASRLFRVLSVPVVSALTLPLLGWVQLTAGDANDPAMHWTSGYEIPYHVHSAGYSGLPLGRVRAAIDRAFTSWELPCGSVTSAPNPNLRDGDTPAMDGRNIIRFEEQRLPPEIDPETVLAFTAHVGVFCTGVVTEADITYNGVTFDWGDGNNENQADVETVGLHEIGHLLGLGHTNFDWAVMYPSIVQRVRHELSRDEEEAICAIYDAQLGDACQRNGDCGGGEVCMVGPSSDETLGIRCGAPLGNGRVGQRCDPDAEYCETGCANGFCLASGVCSTLCHADGDCPNGWLCFADEIEGGQAYGYCVNLTLCDDNVGVCPAGEVCTVSERPSGDALFRICADVSGAGVVGDACRGGETCETGLCIDGLCTAPCDSPADCPAPLDCLPTDFSVSSGGSDTVTLCLVDERPCDRNADCDAGLSCVFRNAGDATTTECARSLGGGPAGEACNSARDCEAGVCLGDVCTAPCRAVADCPGGWLCDRAPILGHPASACVPGDAPPPPSDAGPLGPPPDANPGPSVDAAAPAPLPDGDVSGLDFRLEPTLADGGLTVADIRSPATLAPDAAAGGAVRQGGASTNGCQATPGARAAWGPLLLAVPLVGLRRRRGERGPRSA